MHQRVGRVAAGAALDELRLGLRWLFLAVDDEAVRDYTHSAKVANDHHRCVPPIDSSDSRAPTLAAIIPIIRP